MNNNYIEVITIDMNAWDYKKTYHEGEKDFAELTKGLEFSEASDYENLLAERTWNDADETGSDAMRYFLIVERYGWNEGRQYWQDIHTDIFRVNDEGAA